MIDQIPDHSGISNGVTVWITGLSGAEKTAICRSVHQLLCHSGRESLEKRAAKVFDSIVGFQNLCGILLEDKIRQALPFVRKRSLSISMGLSQTMAGLLVINSFP